MATDDKTVESGAHEPRVSILCASLNIPCENKECNQSGHCVLARLWVSSIEPKVETKLCKSSRVLLWVATILVVAYILLAATIGSLAIYCALIGQICIVGE